MGVLIEILCCISTTSVLIWDWNTFFITTTVIVYSACLHSDTNSPSLHSENNENIARANLISEETRVALCRFNMQLYMHFQYVGKHNDNENITMWTMPHKSTRSKRLDTVCELNVAFLFCL